MLMLMMPATFKENEPAECKINKQPARVTWVGNSLYFAFENGKREKRVILSAVKEGVGIRFQCAHIGCDASDYSEPMPGMICMKPSSFHKVPTDDAE
jgi:hypothetical protein